MREHLRPDLALTNCRFWPYAHQSPLNLRLGATFGARAQILGYLRCPWVSPFPRVHAESHPRRAGSLPFCHCSRDELVSDTPSVAANSAAAFFPDVESFNGEVFLLIFTRQANSFHLHDAELLPFGNNEFEPDNACQSLLACIEREEAFEFQLKRTGDVQNIERSATDRGCVLTT